MVRGNERRVELGKAMSMVMQRKDACKLRNVLNNDIDGRFVPLQTLTIRYEPAHHSHLREQYHSKVDGSNQTHYCS